jgi:hypothetical protein
MAYRRAPATCLDEWARLHWHLDRIRLPRETRLYAWPVAPRSTRVQLANATTHGLYETTAVIAALEDVPDAAGNAAIWDALAML